MSGVSQTFDGYTIYRQRQSFHLALLSLAGKGSFQSDGRDGNIEPNQLWIVPAGTTVGYAAHSSWTFAWFHLADTRQWHHLHYHDLSPTRANPTASHLPSLMRLYLENQTSEDQFLALADDTGRLIIDILRLITPFQQQGLHIDQWHRPIALLKNRIRMSPQLDWHLDRLARELNVSRTHCNRIITEHEGVSPTQLVTALRMQLAVELLQSSDYTLDMIAEKLGYATAFSLSRAFKKHIGQSPRNSRAAALANR